MGKDASTTKMSLRDEIAKSYYEYAIGVFESTTGVRPPKWKEISETEKVIHYKMAAYILNIFEKRIDEIAKHSSKIGWINHEQIKWELFE